MNNISDNPYLKMHEYDWGKYSLNTYLFNEYVVEKTVGREELSFSIMNLLSLLRFDVKLSGYKFLAKLTEHYLVKSDYSQDISIEQIARIYGTEKDFIYGNICENLISNTHFPKIASKLLNTRITANECADIKSAVEIIGAIFKIYYNMSVTDEADIADDAISAINFNRIEMYGK